MGTRIVIVLAAVLAFVLIANGVNSQPPGGGANFVRGDYNIDGQVCMGDAVGLLYFIWGIDCYPLCEDAADSNDDGLVDLSDVLDILDVVFMDGPRWENLHCGPDLTYDNLGCEYEPARCEGHGDAGQNNWLPQATDNQY